MVTKNRRMGFLVRCVRRKYRIVRVKRRRVFKTNVVAAEAGRAGGRVGAAERGDDGIVRAAAGETGMRVRCVMDRGSCARAMRGSVRRAWTVEREGARRECAG